LPRLTKYLSERCKPPLIVNVDFNTVEGIVDVVDIDNLEVGELTIESCDFCKKPLKSTADIKLDKFLVYNNCRLVLLNFRGQKKENEELALTVLKGCERFALVLKEVNEVGKTILYRLKASA
jgi:hypothetical protein